MQSIPTEISVPDAGMSLILLIMHLTSRSGKRVMQGDQFYNSYMQDNTSRSAWLYCALFFYDQILLSSWCTLIRETITGLQLYAVCVGICAQYLCL